MLTFDTVYRAFDRVDDIQKAKYASSIMGPPEFQAAVKSWLFESAGLDVDCDIIATPGGTGALSSTIKNTLKHGEAVVYPDIGWGPYITIAKEAGVMIEPYTLFDDNRFNVDSFRETCEKVMRDQGRVLAVINDPCQNPTGYTMKLDEWEKVIEVVNELSEKGPFILLQDIAYVDFTTQGEAYKRSFSRYVGLPDNVLIIIAFSGSKTLTAYGMRVGAQVLISSNDEQRTKMKHACGNTARGVWSTVNNGAMRLFADIALDEKLKEAYMLEKQGFVHLLKERADIFVREAEEVNLPIYPYEEGFFITLKIDDQIVKNELHLKLKTLNIFFVNVYGGLRVAICSIPINKVKGLAKRVKDAYDDVMQTHDENDET